jgi:hypothetical protein
MTVSLMKLGRAILNRMILIKMPICSMLQNKMLLSTATLGKMTLGRMTLSKMASFSRSILRRMPFVFMVYLEFICMSFCLVASVACTIKPEAIFLVVCDPSMNELLVT